MIHHFVFWLLVTIGALTAVVCGYNASLTAGQPRSIIITYGLFAFGGVGLIVLALFLRKWGLA